MEVHSGNGGSRLILHITKNFVKISVLSQDYYSYLGIHLFHRVSRLAQELYYRFSSASVDSVHDAISCER